jgi:mannose-6-phosphate isomerase-like protein (cupin superfamily)
MEKRIYDLDEREWAPLRSDFTQGVSGKSLVPAGLTEVNIVWTRVVAGGQFPAHRDSYHHVFCFLAGEGTGWLGGKSYEIRPGRMVQVPAGVEHGYHNTGTGDLVLLTVNIPVG